MNPHQKDEVAFEAIDEPKPGAKWRSLLDRFWPAYERWFLSEGDRARPGYVTSSRELRKHMPELVPTFEKLVALAGHRDLVARFLASYCPPTYLTACSQAVWSRDESLLVRNYDYSPDYCEGVVLATAWNGRRVVAMSDCLWGVLDGMNEDGLAVSLSFGGRRGVGRGFGVPLVLRYVLEFCSTTDDAVSVLERVPVHMSYNVTVLDRAGRYVTAYLRSNAPALVRAVPCATNHQQAIEWEQHAKATATLERERFLFRELQDPAQSIDRLIDSFLQAPLYSRAFDRGHGTLYTAVYRPATPGIELRWPGATWTLPLDRFTEGQRSVRLG